MALTEAQVAQIEQVLESRFFPYVPKRTDPPTASWTEAQHRIDRLSRSLAAFAVTHFTTLDESNAAATIVDGFGDNGIDAICFDRSTKQLIIVQAKFGRGKAPGLDDTIKFVEGVRDLFKRRFESFGEAFQTHLPRVIDAFDQPELKVKVMLAHIGGNPSKFVTARMQQLIEELNQ